MSRRRVLTYGDGSQNRVSLGWGLLPGGRGCGKCMCLDL